MAAISSVDYILQKHSERQKVYENNITLEPAFFQASLYQVNTAGMFAEGDTEQKSSPLLTFPPEIIIQIFSYLELNDLYVLSECCKTFYTIVNDEELWKTLFHKRYFTDRFSSTSKSYKYSVELFKRNELIHRWKKSPGTHKFLITTTSSFQKFEICFPRLMGFSNDGDIHIFSLDKGKTDIVIPITTPHIYSVSSFNSTACVTGTTTGKLFIKLLSPKAYWSELKEVDQELYKMITSIDIDLENAFSGDEGGNIFTTNLKTAEVVQKLNLSKNPILKIQGLRNVIVAWDSEKIFIVDNGTIKSIEHETQVTFFEVDFGGQVIIIGNEEKLSLYSFNKSLFGRVRVFIIGRNDSIFRVTIEEKSKLSADPKIAGGDGCNMAVMSKTGRVIIINTRDSRSKSDDGSVSKLCEFTPIVDDMQIPLDLVSVCSITINSVVVLLGSYNGFAAIYDVSTGTLLRQISKRFPKRYLPLTPESQIAPVQFISASPNNETAGIIVVGNVIQYFQYGDLDNSFRNKKRSTVHLPFGRRRKDFFKASIKNDLNEIDYLDYEDYKQIQLVEKYNGKDIRYDEELELAIAVNKSLSDQRRDNSEEDDEELLKALKLSQQDINKHSPAVDLYEGLEERSEFERQLEEAMRRSLYE